jgi:hypothetical protein
MAGSIVNTTFLANSSANSTMTVNAPASMVDGDVIVAFCCSDWGTHAVMTAPAGFNIVTEYDGGANKMHLKVWLKTASAEGSTYTFGCDTASDQCAIITAVRGVTVTGAIANTTFANDTSATRVSPSLAGATAGAVLLCGAGKDGDGTTPCTWTPPSGMTEQADVQSPANYTNMTVASLLGPSDPTGTKSFVSTLAATSIGGAQWSLVLQQTGGTAFMPPPPTMVTQGALVRSCYW